MNGKTAQGASRGVFTEPSSAPAAEPDVPPAPAMVAPGSPVARVGGFRRGLRSEGLASFATLGAFAAILLVGYGAWLGGSFLSAEPRAFDIYQNVPPLIVAAGIVVCLACGQFDLSVGAMASLSVFMTIGIRTRTGLPFGAVLIVTLATGAIVGLVNAVLVLRFRISAFLATLATGGIIDGAYTVYGGGTDISPLPNSKAQLPTWFSGLHSFGSFETKVPLGLSWVIVVILAASALFALRQRVIETSRAQLKTVAGSILVVGLLVALAVARLPQQMSWGMCLAFVLYWLIWVVLRFTAFGRGLYAIGGNPVAARLSGVKVNRSIAVAFVTSGTLAALAGVVLAANQGSATPGIADSFLLPAYAAAFLSTVILSNGRFHVWGTLIGAMCVVYISQGLVLGGVKFTWTDVINGAVLVVAVGVSTTLRRRSAT